MNVIALDNIISMTWHFINKKGMNSIFGKTATSVYPQKSASDQLVKHHGKNVYVVSADKLFSLICLQKHLAFLSNVNVT